jgi:RND family efflux transporter MFP subunit
VVIYAHQIHRKKLIPWCTRALAAGLVLCTGAPLLAGCGAKSEQAAAKPRLVQVVAASLDSLTVTVTALGKTEASRRVELAFEVPGTVEALPYDEGDLAPSGAALGMLRQDRFKANLAQATASFDEAKRNLTRMTALSEENVVSDEERERAETALAAAQAALKSAEEDLRGSQVVAPFRGVVARRYCELGQYVSPGTPAFVFMEMDPIVVAAALSDNDVSLVRQGQQAVVRLDAYPGRAFQGKVSEVPVAADEPGGSFPVEVEVPNPDFLIKSGMAAEVSIVVRKLPSVVVLPAEAIIYQNKEPHVFLVSDGIAKRRPIEVQAQSEMRIAVVGVAPGDTVVAAGNRFLRDGEPVRYVMEEATGTESAER